MEVTGRIQIPGMDSLGGKRVLICSCGSGIEPVLAAQAGGEVYAFDISPVAVETAKKVAAFHGVGMTAEAMDFHNLQYPDDFFDVMYGSYILHHIDCSLAGEQMLRCLKPGRHSLFPRE